MKKQFTGYQPNETGQNGIEISVSYNDGSMNYFSGNREEKGFWAYFTVITRNENSTLCTPMHNQNFKMFITPANRRNKKKNEQLLNLIATKEIADMVWNNERMEVYKLIKSFHIN